MTTVNSRDMQIAEAAFANGYANALGNAPKNLEATIAAAEPAPELAEVEFLKVYTSTTGKQLPTTGTSRQELFAIFRAVIAADREKRGTK